MPGRDICTYPLFLFGFAAFGTIGAALAPAKNRTAYIIDTAVSGGLLTASLAIALGTPAITKTVFTRAFVGCLAGIFSAYLKGIYTNIPASTSEYYQTALRGAAWAASTAVYGQSLRSGLKKAKIIENETEELIYPAFLIGATKSLTSSILTLAVDYQAFTSGSGPRVKFVQRIILMLYDALVEGALAALQSLYLQATVPMPPTSAPGGAPSQPPNAFAPLLIAPITSLVSTGAAHFRATIIEPWVQKTFP